MASSVKEVILLVFSLTRPHLEYGIQLWHPHRNNSKNLLEQAQSRVMKVIRGVKHLSYEESLKDQGLWPFNT